MSVSVRFVFGVNERQVSSQVRSLKQEQRELSAELRVRANTWVEVARVFCERYRVNMRVALRLVRGWSQREAADQWNARWPAEPKTFKNFSYWELWPSDTGHAPSLDVLSRLAELYECSVADLLSDGADFRSRDAAFNGYEAVAVPPGRNARDVLPDFAQLDHLDVHELAQRAATWAQQNGDGIDRRSALLKLGAALSLAAASPVLAADAVPAHTPSGMRAHGDLSGIWHSAYVFPSTGRGTTFTGEHYVVLHQQGSRLIGQSVPHTTGSRLRLELAVEHAVATGTWREQTSPTGYYRGAVYHGTLQLVVDPAGRRMTGMWLGFGRDFTINSGEWALRLCDANTSKTVQRQYHDRV